MKNTQENLSTLTIWSRNVTTSTREPPTCAWIRADIWRQDGPICSKNRKIVPYHRCARIPRLTVSIKYSYHYYWCHNASTHCVHCLTFLPGSHDLSSPITSPSVHLHSPTMHLWAACLQSASLKHSTAKRRILNDYSRVQGESQVKTLHWKYCSMYKCGSLSWFLKY